MTLCMQEAVHSSALKSINNATTSFLLEKSVMKSATRLENARALPSMKTVGKLFKCYI